MSYGGGSKFRVVPVHRHIGHPCSLHVHSADASNLLNSNNNAVRAFLHVQWNKVLEVDMSICLGRGIRHTVVYKMSRQILYGNCVLNAAADAAAVFSTPCTQRCYCCDLKAVAIALKPTMYTTLPNKSGKCNWN